MNCKFCDKEIGNKGGLITHEKTCEKVQKIKEDVLKMYLEDLDSIKTISKKYKMGKQIIIDILGNNIRSRSESGKIARKKYPYKHTEESKKIMREKRLKWMKENPEKTAWRKSTMSYIEERFFDKIKDLEWDKKYSIEYEKSFFPYFADFSFLNEKVVVELDGKQHELEERKDSDDKKDELLISMGWKVFRIKESQLRNDIDGCVKELEVILNNSDVVGKYECGIEKYKKKENKKKCECGELIGITSKRCKKCDEINQRRVERPPYEQLVREINETNCSVVGRKYGVSHGSIKKWVKCYEIEIG